MSWSPPQEDFATPEWTPPADELSNEPSWGDIPGNIVEGLKETPQTLSGIAQMAKTGNDLMNPMSWAQSGAQYLSGTPLAETNTGQAARAVKEGNENTLQTLKNLPGNIQEFASHPGQSVKSHIIEHPISTAVDVASIGLPALRGASEVGAKYAGRFGENQMGKLHGTSPAQFRQLGRENFGDAMRSSFEKGDADFALGSIGREQMINERINQIGSEIGDIRAQAAGVGAPMSPQEMSEAVRKQVMSDFSPGGKYFDETGELQKQLKNIQSMPEGGIENFADRASIIKRNAAGKKLTLPANAETEIANKMSQVNDAELARRLPAQAEQYELLKDEYGNAKSLVPMEKIGESKEALGRTSNTAFGFVKDLAHSAVGGPKLGAKLGFGAEGVLGDVAENAGAYRTMGLSGNLASQLGQDDRALEVNAEERNNPEEILKHVMSDPDMSKWRTTFQDASQRGPKAITANHFTLLQRDPEYNKAFSYKWINQK